jgi:hypothetical protein
VHLLIIFNVNSQLAKTRCSKKFMFCLYLFLLKGKRKKELFKKGEKFLSSCNNHFDVGIIRCAHPSDVINVRIELICCNIHWLSFEIDQQSMFTSNKPTFMRRPFGKPCITCPSSKTKTCMKFM